MSNVTSKDLEGMTPSQRDEFVARTNSKRKGAEGTFDALKARAILAQARNKEAGK